MLTKRAYLLLLPVVLCCNVVTAITINNQDINEILKPGESMRYTARVGADNIAFEFENGNLSVGSAVVNNAQTIFNRFVEFSNEQHGSMRMNRLTVGGSSQFLDGQHISSLDEELVIDAKNNFLINEVLLKSKTVAVITDRVECGVCFVDSDELVLVARSPQALCAIVRFSRDQQSKKPMVLSGQMNFADPNSNERLVVLGAKDMTIVFSSDAFK